MNNNYTLGGYGTIYYYWTDENSFTKALLNGDTTLEKDGSINSSLLNGFDLSNAVVTNNETELKQAQKAGKVYAYLQDAKAFYIPNQD